MLAELQELDQQTAGRLLADRVRKQITREARRLHLDYAVNNEWIRGERRWVARLWIGGIVETVAVEQDYVDALLKLRKRLRFNSPLAP